MKAIYETRGRAREYCELAINLYTGCSHNCIYCYGAAVTHQDKERWGQNPQPRKGIIWQIQRDAERYSKLNEKRPILMCFVTDPYQPADDTHRLARKAILWVSCEPVIYPEATFELIKLTAPFVDHYKVGTLNYHPHGKTIDWPKFAREVKQLLEGLGKPYYLKRDLVGYLKGGTNGQ